MCERQRESKRGRVRQKFLDKKVDCTEAVSYTHLDVYKRQL